jgi:hypothetical protein
MIDITPRAAAANRRCLRSWIDPREFNGREIDHQRVVRDSQPARVVSAAANRKQHFIFAREINARNDIGHIRAPGDQARFFWIIAL